MISPTKLGAPLPCSFCRTIIPAGATAMHHLTETTSKLECNACHERNHPVVITSKGL